MYENKGSSKTHNSSTIHFALKAYKYYHEHVRSNLMLHAFELAIHSEMSQRIQTAKVSLPLLV
jgi:hypothetical protein